MAIGIATILLILTILYFIWQTAQDQNLDLDFSVYYSPRRAEVKTRIETGVPKKEIWQVLTDLSNYPAWFPWIRKVRVTNKNADRWVHRHSLQHFRMEVGSRFKIQPFLFAPLTHSRFLSIDPEAVLRFEARFFPMNREIVTFSLTPSDSIVEITYTATSRSLFNFMTGPLFSWRGKNVLKNLADRLPHTVPRPQEKEAPTPEQAASVDQPFLDALVAKALHDGDEILARITDRTTRAKAKSAYMKAKRAGDEPEVTPEAVAAVERFLAGQEPPAPKAPPTAAEGKEAPSSQDAQINDLVARALAGDDDVINSIQDRVLRARAKAALVKAKRTGTTTEAPSAPEENAGSLIDAAVKKALEGDMEAINAISDRIIRARAKSAYMKAKRQRE